MTHARVIASSKGLLLFIFFCCRLRWFVVWKRSPFNCNAYWSEDALIRRSMACVTRLKDDTRFLECTFPRTHGLFQILSASVDEVVCRFIFAGEQATRPGQSIVLTANFGVRWVVFIVLDLLSLMRSKPSVVSFKNALVKPSDIPPFIAEPCHSSCNWSPHLIDEKLSFKEHIHDKIKAYRGCLVWLNKILNTSQLKVSLLYKNMVRSHLYI